MMKRVFDLFVKLALALVALACVLPILMSAGAPRCAPSPSPIMKDEEPDTRALACVLGYVLIGALGLIAWRWRGVARPPERLPGRQRALPPAPRGPDA